ncbi:recombinase family protein [Vibrio parahaemolyticus]|uniref:recombinase family protein n=1 Tax=Vibrio parahaemolyticus TaxID=670 RepID=UPI0005F13358|nr:recombinase family protein [Vibrio parahaemolyticus]
MIAYPYKRFSFNQQEKGDSIRRQSKLIDSYCLEHSLTLSDKTFEDLGVSAFRSSNSKEDAGLGQFLQALQEGKLETPCYLLVESLDRLSRDNIDSALTQFMNIIQADVTIVTLFDNKTYKKGMDVVDYLTALISMQRANEESRIKSQRISASWKNRQSGIPAKKSKGCPFWLSVSDCKTFYEVNHRVDVVHKIFALANDGLGSRLIAKALNAEEVPSPKGKNWSDATVNGLLNSRAVIGEYQPKQRYNSEGVRVDMAVGSPIKDYYPAIMTEDEFLITQDGIKSRQKTSKRGASKTFLNVVKGVATCGCCGSPMRLRKQLEYYYLECNKRSVGICSDSNRINLRFIIDWLREVWLTPEYAPIIASDAPESKELRVLESDLDKLNNTLKKLLGLLDDDADDVIFDRIKAKKAEKKALLQKIDECKESLAPFNVTKKALWKRFTLVKIAFMDENTEETIKARCQLAQLINQLKGFKVTMSEDKIATLEVTDSKGNVALYKSRQNPYYVHCKESGSIWKKEP